MLDNSETSSYLSHSRNEGGQSRYFQDFNEIERIGRGSYGSVFKVRNKLDGNHYAIKKILVNDQIKKRVLKEVQLLSKFQSQSIVRYFQSWSEYFDCQLN